MMTITIAKRLLTKAIGQRPISVCVQTNSWVHYRGLPDKPHETTEFVVYLVPNPNGDNCFMATGASLDDVVEVAVQALADTEMAAALAADNYGIAEPTEST